MLTLRRFVRLHAIRCKAVSAPAVHHSSLVQNGARFSSHSQFQKSESALEAVYGQLERLFKHDKNAISRAASVREQHSHDECHIRNNVPDIVVSPSNVDEVSAVARICNEARVPLIPFGTGTGIEGGVTAPFGGICVRLANLDEVTAVNESDFDCTVQAGVTRLKLNAHLRGSGLWFPIDPGADASLCGMCATSASGTNAVKYGTMRENVLNLEVVLASGKIIHTRGHGRRARKSAAGYNLTNLFVGSEGTLGVITSATLKLYGIPESMAAAVCSFPDVASAINTVVNVLQSCIPIARIEFLDEVQIDACNKYSSLSLAVQPTLFMEFHGSSAQISEQASAVKQLCKENNGSEFNWAIEQTARDQLWKARHSVLYACLALRPGSRAFPTDVCVPISALPDTISKTKTAIERSGLIAPIVGHVGDGNFHCTILVDPNNPEELRKAKEISDACVRIALAANGTCTGEHGIGWGKKQYLAEELGAETVVVLKTVKRALDPNGIMNPGKIIDI